MYRTTPWSGGQGKWIGWKNRGSEEREGSGYGGKWGGGRGGEEGEKWTSREKGLNTQDFRSVTAITTAPRMTKAAMMPTISIGKCEFFDSCTTITEIVVELERP